MSAGLYPLRFRPVFQRYLWGGQRLRTLLGKDTGDGPCAESWELCDRGADQTVVAHGPLAGTTLHELVARFGRDLLGPAADRVDGKLPPQDPRGRFPLLVKFLDAAKSLSVQVHPNDAQAAALEPPDLGKTEAWVVLDAAPGSVIYAGLQYGTDRAGLAAAIREGRCEEVLHRFPARVGECVFIPAGTVHALGAGLLVAEVQQTSDTTFRLFDWDRLGPDGQPRPLHVDQALEVIDFSRGPVEAQTPMATDQPGLSRLVHCDKFTLDRWDLSAPRELGGDGRLHVLLVERGEVAVEGAHTGGAMPMGTTILLPAALEPVRVTPVHAAATLLDAGPI